LVGREKHIEIAPLVFAKSKRKNWKVHNALKDNAWVGKIELGMDFSFQHLSQFINLWGLLQEVHLVEDVEDSIVWKLTENGQYSSKSAYNLQFLGSTLSPLYHSVWKAWTPQKFKTFAWTAIQNRIWMA
jgi:hypothetical protein